MLKSSKISRVRVRNNKKEKYGYYKGRCIPRSPSLYVRLCSQVPSRSRSLQCSRSFCGHTTSISPASRPLIPHPSTFILLSLGNLERFKTMLVVTAVHVCVFACMFVCV